MLTKICQNANLRNPKIDQSTDEVFIFRDFFVKRRDLDRNAGNTITTGGESLVLEPSDGSIIFGAVLKIV